LTLIVTLSVSYMPNCLTVWRDIEWQAMSSEMVVACGHASGGVVAVRSVSYRKSDRGIDPPVITFGTLRKPATVELKKKK
jgi:hypothetical protein